MIKSIVLAEKQLDLGLDAIRTAEREIHPWTNLVDRDGSWWPNSTEQYLQPSTDSISHHKALSAISTRNHDALTYLLQSMDVPLRRMDDRLNDLNDNLQSKCLSISVE